MTPVTNNKRKNIIHLLVVEKIKISFYGGLMVNALNLIKASSTMRFETSANKQNTCVLIIVHDLVRCGE